jgi:hypothetical protein
VTQICRKLIYHGWLGELFVFLQCLLRYAVPAIQKRTAEHDQAYDKRNHHNQQTRETALQKSVIHLE